MHPDKIADYDALTAAARKRKVHRNESNDSGSVKKLKQQQLETTVSFSNANYITQSKVDRLIVNFVIQGILPMRIVEQPEFVQLITGLQPNRCVMDRRTLRRKIEEMASNTKAKLISTLRFNNH